MECTSQHHLTHRGRKPSWPENASLPQARDSEPPYPLLWLTCYQISPLSFLRNAQYAFDHVCSPDVLFIKIYSTWQNADLPVAPSILPSQVSLGFISMVKAYDFRQAILKSFFPSLLLFESYYIPDTFTTPWKHSTCNSKWHWYMFPVAGHFHQWTSLENMNTCLCDIELLYVQQ